MFRFVFLPSFGLFESVTFAVGFQDMNSMRESIQHGPRQPFAA
jgi:hypothetical protein